MKDFFFYLAVALLFGLILYFNVAMIVFALEHPELTDTQRLMHVWDAITFQ